ncbi:hypothetical protein BC827DRAFT_1264219 [Russula dissimulans]|nr:hypothetical protein BC827DRAFT_1264219 [Russula dissimulans]
MAPSLKKALKDFINDIPKEKLEGFPSTPGTLYSDRNLRLDLQGLTKTAYNLQIQANNNAPNTSVRKAAPDTVAAVLKEFTSKATAEDVREAFHKSVKESKVVTLEGKEDEDDDDE